MRQTSRKSLLFAVAAILLFAGGAEAQNFQTGTIKGTVTFNSAPITAGTGAPPLYVGIQSLGAFSTSGAAGSYEIDTVTPGTYTLGVWCNGEIQNSGLLASTSITVVANATTTQNFEVSGVAGNVSGQVTVNGTGVQAYTRSATISDDYVGTDGTGHFTRWYPAGTYTQNVYTSNGTQLGTFNFTITKGVTNNLSPVNFQTGNVKGTVTFNGTPIPAGTGSPALYVGIQSLGAYSSTGSAGTYEIDNLLAGTYTLGVWCNGEIQNSGLLASTSITISGGGVVTQNFEVASTVGDITSQITVNGAGVQAYTRSATISDDYVGTDSTGHFTRWYPAGTYTQNVYTSNGTQLGSFSFTITKGATNNLAAVNFQTGNVKGVVSFGGSPIASGTGSPPVYVGIQSLGAYSTTGATGAYEIDNLLAGTYTLGVWSNGEIQATGLLGTVSITITGGGVVTQNFDVTATTGEVSGQITLNGVGAQVYIRNATISDDYVGTDSTGHFRRFYQPGNYTANVYSSNGVLIGSFTFTTTAGAVTSADQGTVATGTNVAISGNGGSGSVGGITVTFSNVTGSGGDTITSGATGPNPPAGYSVVGPRYYNVATTATYTGTMQVCIQYDPSLVTGGVGNLKLTDAANSFAQLSNQTNDTSAHVICGTTTTVSTWAILQPLVPALTPATATLEANGKLTLVASSGSGSGYTFALAGAGSIAAGTVAGTEVYTAGGVAGQTATITVTDSAAHSGTATITIGPALTLAPASVTLISGATQQFTAANGAGYTYAVNAGASGSISATGLYTAGAKGGIDTVTVTDAAGASAQAQVTITSPLSLTPATVTVIPRGTQQFTPSGGAAGATYTWTISPATGAGVISATGFYTAPATAGATATITVTSNGSNATAAVTVGAGVSVLPAAPSVAPRATRQFSASGGSGAPYAWTLGSSPKGSIDLHSGLYTAGAAPGTDTVTATDSFGNTGTSVITTTAAISITPSTVNLAPAGTQSFSAAGGNGGPYTWSVNSGASGSINASTGAYTAGTFAATDTVTATDALHNSATAMVTVTAPLNIAPLKALVPPLGTQQFTATGGTGPMAGYTWSVSGAGSINSGGLYTAPTLSGNIDTVSVTDQNNVTVSTVITTGAGIAITPAGAVVPPNGSQQFSASGGAGAPFTWSAAGPGSINSSGLYSAPSTPNVADSVTAMDTLGNSVTVNLTVGPGISLTNASLDVAPRGTLQLVAIGGSGAGYTYSLQQPASGTVDATGLYSSGANANVSDTVTITDSLKNTFSATITVTGPLVLDATSVNLPPRGSHQFTVSGGSGAGYSWDALAPVDGSIDSTGLFTAGGIGNQTVQIAVSDPNGNMAVATIHIGPSVSIDPSNVNVAPLGTFQFTAAGGNGEYTWSLFPPAHGSITQSGLYTATSAGTFSDTVAVTDSLGNSASAAIFSTDALAIIPGSATVPPHGKLQLAAAGGTGAGLVWSLASPASGSITALGLYTAAGPGAKADTVNVVDSLGNSATATISVGPGVSISPLTATVAPRGSQQFTATGGSGSGYFWSLQTNAAGTISTGGLYTAGTASALDTVTVIDTLGNSASTTIATSSVLAITPGTATVAPNATQQFSTTGGAGGLIGWRVLGSGTISVTGLYHASSTPGIADTVVATDTLGNTATATISVGEGVTITPANATVAPRGTQQFSATGGTNAGFSYSVQGNGSISATGLYTASSLGGFDTVTVTDSAGNTASSKITITSTLTISPSSASILSGATAQFSASGGSGSGFTWSVTGNDGGTITQAGLYTAGASTGTDTVTVTDSNGNSASVTVVVTAATGSTDGGTGTGTTSTSSGCSTSSGNLAPQLLGIALAFLLFRRRKVAAKV